MDTLVTNTLATHRSLQERLEAARSARPSSDPDHPRDHYPAIDTFLAAASQHANAVVDTLVPAARRRIEDGEPRMRDYLEKHKRYEEVLNQVKAKLYGSTFATTRPWSQVWDEVADAFESLWRDELEMVIELAGADPTTDWSSLLVDATERAPTRPHPHIPHSGAAGKVARGVARRIDHFLDAAEGRMVPEPVRVRDREADGPMVQYLLGDPHLGGPDGEEPLRPPRARRRPEGGSDSPRTSR